MRQMTAEVATSKPDAIAIVCTNMRGAPLAEELEAKYGIPGLRHHLDDRVGKPEGCWRRHETCDRLGTDFLGLGPHPLQHPRQLLGELRFAGTGRFRPRNCPSTRSARGTSRSSIWRTTSSSLATAPISIWNEMTLSRSTMPRRNSNEFDSAAISNRRFERASTSRATAARRGAFRERHGMADAIAQPDLASRSERMIRRHQRDEALPQAHQRWKFARNRRAEHQHQIDLVSRQRVIARSWSNTFTSNATAGNFAR